MNGTSYGRKRGLSAKQYRAIPLVLLGKKDTQVAREVGVHRVTVTNWRNRDPVFAAELHAGRRRMMEDAVGQIRRLRTAALAVVEKALVDGDLATAQLVFRTLAPPLVAAIDMPGEEVPHVIEEQWAERERDRVIGVGVDKSLLLVSHPLESAEEQGMSERVAVAIADAEDRGFGSAVGRPIVVDDAFSMMRRPGGVAIRLF